VLPHRRFPKKLGYVGKEASAMNHYLQEKTILEERPIQTVTFRPSLLHRLLARYRARQLEHRRQENARQLEHRRQENARQLASHLEEVMIGCELTQLSYTLTGNFNLRAPRVLSVIDGSPVTVDIHILPGQTPDHFAQHAPTIAYNLGLAEVRVVPLGPDRVRLELFQRSG
jgi:hypothetical protein